MACRQGGFWSAFSMEEATRTTGPFQKAGHSSIFYFPFSIFYSREESNGFGNKSRI